MKIGLNFLSPLTNHQTMYLPVLLFGLLLFCLSHKICKHYFVTRDEGIKILFCSKHDGRIPSFIEDNRSHAKQSLSSLTISVRFRKKIKNQLVFTQSVYDY